MADSEKRNRSGPHPTIPGDHHDIDTRMLEAIKLEAETRSRQSTILEGLLEEFKGLREDMNAQAKELNAHKLARAELDGEVRGKLKSHDDQLANISDMTKEKRTAWVGVVPSIIVAIVGTILSSAIIGGLLLSAIKEQLAAVVQPASAHEQATQNPASGKP